MFFPGSWGPESMRRNLFTISLTVVASTVPWHIIGYHGIGLRKSLIAVESVFVSGA